MTVGIGFTVIGDEVELGYSAVEVAGKNEGCGGRGKGRYSRGEKCKDLAGDVSIGRGGREVDVKEEG